MALAKYFPHSTKIDFVGARFFAFALTGLLFIAVIVALFVTSVATGIITTYVANRGEPRTDSVAATSLSTWFDPEEGPAPTAEQIPAGLASIPGVRSVTLVHGVLPPHHASLRASSMRSLLA